MKTIACILIVISGVLFSFSVNAECKVHYDKLKCTCPEGQTGGVNIAEDANGRPIEMLECTCCTKAR